MTKGSSIESENGVLELVLRQIGNLELMCRNTSLWSSNTTDSNIDVFEYQSNGNLAIRKTDGTCAWESNTANTVEPPDRLLLQNDGNLVLYAGDDPRWSMETYGKCPTGKFCKEVIALSFLT